MKTIDLIKNAAVELFATKGFEGTSIRDIASKANINSATLYHYIGNKEELLFQIMDEELAKLTNLATEVMKHFTVETEKLLALSYLHTKIHGTRRLEMRVTDNEFKSLTGDQRRIIKEKRKNYEEIWTEIVHRGKETKEFQANEHTKMIVYSLILMNTGIVHWFNEKGDLSLEEISKTFANLSLNVVKGISNKQDEIFSKVEVYIANEE